MAIYNGPVPGTSTGTWSSGTITGQTSGVYEDSTGSTDIAFPLEHEAYEDYLNGLGQAILAIIRTPAGHHYSSLWGLWDYLKRQCSSPGNLRAKLLLEALSLRYEDAIARHRKFLADHEREVDERRLRILRDSMYRQAANSSQWQQTSTDLLQQYANEEAKRQLQALRQRMFNDSYTTTTTKGTK